MKILAGGIGFLLGVLVTCATIAWLEVRSPAVILTADLDECEFPSDYRVACDHERVVWPKGTPARMERVGGLVRLTQVLKVADLDQKVPVRAATAEESERFFDGW